MVNRSHAERDELENRLYELQEKRFDRIQDKLEETHDTAKEGLRQSLLTNARVTHLETDVKDGVAKANKLADNALARAIKVDARLVDLENDVKPILSKRELKAEVKSTPFWQDPFIRRVIIVIGGIIILAAIGFNNEDIRGFFSGS